MIDPNELVEAPWFTKGQLRRLLECRVHSCITRWLKGYLTQIFRCSPTNHRGVLAGR